MSKIIGIDLGTTYSAIAQLDDLGNPEVLASTDTNKKITASIVYLKDKNVIVGDKAIDALDEAGSRVHITNINVPKTITELENKLQSIQNEKKQVVKKHVLGSKKHVKRHML